MKAFNFQEDVVSTEVTVTDGFGDGGVGILAGTTFTTASLSVSQNKYYYNLQYNSKDHISVSYGHIAGSGSAEQSATLQGTTKAVYGQFYNLLETDRSKLKKNEIDKHFNWERFCDQVLSEIENEESPNLDETNLKQRLYLYFAELRSPMFWGRPDNFYKFLKANLKYTFQNKL